MMIQNFVDDAWKGELILDNQKNLVRFSISNHKILCYLVSRINEKSQRKIQTSVSYMFK